MGKKAVIIILLVLVIDQIVKILVKTKMGFYHNQTIPVIDGFFQLYYIENKGMAFGTTLGSGVFAKYALSIFRLLAIFGIGYYIRKLLKQPGTKFGMILAISLIFAGAAGNLIDSMIYDFIWDLDPNIPWNWAEGSDGNWILDETGNPVLRPRGFLLASVVDMFQFTLTWPSWMPWGLGGEQIFGAIWNVADAAITFGVMIIIFGYRKFFKKPQTDHPEDPPLMNETIQASSEEQ